MTLVTLRSQGLQRHTYRLPDQPSGTKPVAPTHVIGLTPDIPLPTFAAQLSLDNIHSSLSHLLLHQQLLTMEGLLAEINSKKKDISSGDKYLRRGDAQRAREEEEARRKDEARKRKAEETDAASEERASKLRKEVSC